MKAVILAGGLGTRLSEETDTKPKPMVEIGSKPILWHIMKIYAAHGINEFIICLGYKGYVIKEYFSNYFLHNSDVTFDLKNNQTIVHRERAEDWKITLVDTGDNSMTGGRIARIKSFIEGEKAFCLTYGDGVGDVNITDLVKFHENHGKLATVTSSMPRGRYGHLMIGSEGLVVDFQEKKRDEVGWINSGFFVLSPKVIDLIDDDQTIWEHNPMQTLSREGDLFAFRHSGFWQAMDTLREKNELNELWANNQAPWKIW
ncbi:glucose-1-phosphate cytidylyltransferase [Paracoccaceae bacterium]|nr:glucose-1-phosphate cytidylyltransferase [Paracoccaceae bacterium]